MNNEGIIKDSIINAAQEIFSKYGYKKTTLDDIAQNIGKGKSALYYYFKSKEAIFKAVLEFEVGQLSEQLVNALAKENNPQRKLRTYILKRMELFHQVVNFYSAIQQEYYENIGFIEKARKDFDEQELLMISGIIKEGIDNGDFTNRNVKFTAGAIIVAMRGFEYTFSKEKDLRKVENDIDKLLDILFYGIVIRK